MTEMTSMPGKSTEEVIRESLDDLRAHGWLQGAGFSSVTGKRCIESAIHLTLVNGEWRALDKAEAGAFCLAVSKIANVISEQYPDRSCVAYQFNDDSRTTFEDVERVMEKAAQS